MIKPPVQVHGTCIAIDGVGVLLSGPSGSGKSDLALRLIDQGARLVADDRVDLRVRQERLQGAAPQMLHGLLEVRGVGILRLAALESAPVCAVIELGDQTPEERLPGERWQELAGLPVPVFQLNPWRASTPAKVRLVSQLVTGSISRIDD